jgi:RNA polymerase sigma factor (sigma-70 family)
MNNNSSPKQLADHLFRYEAGKMIAVFTKVFGIQNLALVEDVVQDAFLKAMQTWSFNNIPDNPAAWLMQTARNRALDVIRRQQNFSNHSKVVSQQLQEEAASAVEQFFSENEIADSQLQMIFACCHPLLKQEDQVAFTLKTVSGFGVAEIARALLTSEPVIQKRLYRAKQSLKDSRVQLEIPAGADLKKRLETVATVLYLLFNEGYNSIKADELIRTDLCMEAMRLCLLLIEHKVTQHPEIFALLSLMCFQSSRFQSRLDENNSIILLQQQDRSKWNKQLINLGYEYLNQSSKGDLLTVYHLESAIAAEYAMAEAFEQTNWTRILGLYDLLSLQKNTPVVILNRAIVLSQLGSTREAINAVLQINNVEKLLQSQYIYNAVLGDFYLKLGDIDSAEKYLVRSYQLTTSQAEKKLIAEKLTVVYTTAP